MFYLRNHESYVKLYQAIVSLVRFISEPMRVMSNYISQTIVSLVCIISETMSPRVMSNYISQTIVSLVCYISETMRAMSNKMNCELILTYDTHALWQTGSRNLTGPKTLPTIWGTYMKLVTKYQISAINSC